MKKLFTLVVGVVCFSLLIFISFSPVQGTESKVVKLKLASSMMPMFPQAKVLKKWAKDIETRSDARVKIKLYLGDSLVKGDQVRKALLRGIADITWMPIADDPNAYRLNSVMELPVMGFPDERVATRIHREIIKEFPEVKAEFKGTEILWQYMVPPQLIHTRKEIRTPEDIKGVKISSFGMNLKVLDALGAVAIGTLPMEAYMTVERGVADGSMCPYFAAVMIRTLDMLPYHNEMPFNYGCVHMIISSKVWKKLSPGIRDIFQEVGAAASEEEFNMMYQLEENARKKAEKLGHHFVKNTPEMAAVWQKKVEPMHEKWIDNMEKKGLPARAVYNEVKRLNKKYSGK